MIDSKRKDIMKPEEERPLNWPEAFCIACLLVTIAALGIAALMQL